MDKRKLSLPATLVATRNSPPTSRSNSLSGSGGTKWWQSIVNSINQVTNNGQIKPIAELQQKQRNSFGSTTVAVQKLRESKWFTVEEQKLFCAVIENGFIVEVRLDQDSVSWYGVVMCNNKKDKKPRLENVIIYSTKINRNDIKIVKMSVADLWQQGNKVRINNFGDKENKPHLEKVIKQQITDANKLKHLKWHNSQHFAYWCRYGVQSEEIRKRQMSECVRWGTFGMNAGVLMVLNKQKSVSATK